MDRNEQLSPSHEANLAKGSSSGPILLALFALLVGYILFTTGGVGGKAIVVAVVVGGSFQLIRRWLTRRQPKA